MERLARLVVHVEEAFACAERDDEHHLRLALLLFDSAAELLLHRESKTALDWQRHQRRTLDLIGEQETRGRQLTPEIRRIRAELAATTLSLTKRREINRAFDAKVDFVVDRGTLPQACGRALKKLHRYRNEAYHRDELRPATLRTAVWIYAFLVCRMMQAFSVAIFSLVKKPPSVLAKYGVGIGISFDDQERVGSALLQRIGLGDDSERVASLLADHVADRIEGMLEALDFVAEFLAESTGKDQFDRETVLHAVQLDPHEILTLPSPRDIALRPVACTLATLAAWSGAVDILRREGDHIDAFARFADLEDAFEHVEQQIIDNVIAIDREIQVQTDIARGK
jgi:hypothetical protein